MKLEAWQADLLIKIEEGYSQGTEQFFMMAGRQVGKSTWYALYNQFMNKPAKRFQVAPQVDGITSHLLLIEDYMWWTDNEREILNWMADNLPNGIDHQQGMIITFDNDQDRMMFLLRWA
jgi:hypothetical protein